MKGYTPPPLLTQAYLPLILNDTLLVPTMNSFEFNFIRGVKATNLACSLVKLSEIFDLEFLLPPSS